MLEIKIHWTVGKLMGVWSKNGENRYLVGTIRVIFFSFFPIPNIELP